VAFELFLYFLVNGILFAPFTKFLELYFSLNFLFILSAPVIDSFAIFTGEFD